MSVQDEVVKGEEYLFGAIGCSIGDSAAKGSSIENPTLGIRRSLCKENFAETGLRSGLHADHRLGSNRIPLH